MAKDMIECPQFEVNWKQMGEMTLVQYVDYLRLHKDASKYPFFVIKLPDRFNHFFDIKNRTLSDDLTLEFAKVPLYKCNDGVYFMDREYVNAEVADLNQVIARMNDKVDVRNLEKFLGRKTLSKISQYQYISDSDASVMADIHRENKKEIPVGWCLNDLTDELKNFIGDVRGVVTPMIYAGTSKTFSSMHVEDMQLSSYPNMGIPELPNAQEDEAISQYVNLIELVMRDRITHIRPAHLPQVLATFRMSFARRTKEHLEKLI